MASIRRRKGRKSGWIVDYRDISGGRRLTVKTREDAELLRAKMIQESQQAAPVVEDRDITVDGYSDKWLERIGSSVDERTAEGYRDTLRLHIRPMLGKVMLRGLLRGHIKALLAKKRAEGLSKNSVRIIRATLSVMLSDAVDDGLLMVSPVLGINRKGRKSPDSISQADRKKNVRAMTHEQLATFLAFSSGPVLAAPSRLPPPAGGRRAPPWRGLRGHVDRLRPGRQDAPHRARRDGHRAHQADQDRRQP